MAQYEISYTNYKERINPAMANKPDPEYDPKKAEHCWVVVSTHVININNYKSRIPALLDHESLMSIVGPGCFFCENLYINAEEKCPGPVG